MKQSSISSSRLHHTAQFLFVASLATALFVCSTLAMRPMSYLVGVVPDDTFYYLKIAQNFARTGYSSFDNINPTNGYHPAWMLMLAALSKLVPDREAFVRAAVFLSTAAHLGTSILMVKVLGRWMSRTAALLGGALYAIYPLPLAMSVMALESNIYALALLLVAYVFLKLIAPHVALNSLGRVAILDWVLIGLCFGLAFLARTEAIVYLVCFFFWLWARIFRERDAKWIHLLFRSSFAVGLPFLFVVSPWLAYSKRLVGHWGQDSGQMKMLWAYQGGPKDRIIDAFTHRMPELFRFLFINLIVTPLEATFGIDGSNGSGGARKYLGAIASFLLVALFVMLLRSARNSRGKPSDDPQYSLFVWLSSGVVLSSAIYGLFFANSQPWYAGAPGMVLFLITFGIVGRSLEPWPHAAWKRNALVMASISGMAICAVRFAMSPIYFSRQPDVYASQPRFEKLADQGARIGSFNAGIPGYFSDRNIINLDGLVNSAVVPYWSEHRFDAYLHDANIKFIFDDGTIAKGDEFSSKPIERTVIDHVPLHTIPPETRWAWRLGQ